MYPRSLRRLRGSTPQPSRTAASRTNGSEAGADRRGSGRGVGSIGVLCVSGSAVRRVPFACTLAGASSHDQPAEPSHGALQAVQLPAQLARSHMFQAPFDGDGALAWGLHVPPFRASGAPSGIRWIRGRATEWRSDLSRPRATPARFDGPNQERVQQRICASVALPSFDVSCRSGSVPSVGAGGAPAFFSARRTRADVAARRRSLV
jgi:hypothetical protein